MNDPYRTNPPRSLTDMRMDALERRTELQGSELFKWATRTTWHLFVIAALVVTVTVLIMISIRQLQNDMARTKARVDDIKCEMDWWTR